MNIIERFLAFALLGATWVLWLLVALSVVSVAVMIERLRFYLSTRIQLGTVADALAKALRKGGVEEAKKVMSAEKCVVETAVVHAGLDHVDEGAHAVEHAMEAARAIQKPVLERNLAFLGTIGNNAPFIGLLGTVIGIVKAFHALSRYTQGGASAVMYEISEALVATAIGLFVALPAVAAFNYFRTRVKLVNGNIDGLQQVVLAWARGSSREKKES
jgi:biopolymer transport protein ExbB